MPRQRPRVLDFDVLQNAKQNLGEGELVIKIKNSKNTTAMKATEAK